MLQLMRRSRTDDFYPLSDEDDRALRRAFGRYGRHAARPEGARVVREHQGGRGGQWFACDCRGGAMPPPVLVPVDERFVRRHIEPPWPEHAEWCDFYREAEEQRAVSMSFRRPATGDGHLRLVRTFASAEPLERTLKPAGPERTRPRLARLLFDLLERSGLTRVEPGPVPSIAEQFKALRKTAEAVDLDVDLPLSRFLCAYPPALPEFVERIGRTPKKLFRHARRPHGVLLGVAKGAAQGQVVPAHGDPIEVAGAISIFGEADGHAAGRRETVGERAPYLMACVVGRRHPDEPVQVLRAYLHPCVSPTWLLPVDSNHERGTLRQLLSLRRWLADNRQIPIIIDKPVFDLAVAPAKEDADPHEPVIPDFIVRAPRARDVVVETMGYDLPAYRARKARMHGEMSRVCGGAAVIEHDFCRPPERTQDDRDRRFWRECRWAITGPESEGDARPIPPRACPAQATV